MNLNYGITQDLNTKDYIMVMQYVKKGNLRFFFENQNIKIPSTAKQIYLKTDIQSFALN